MNQQSEEYLRQASFLQFLPQATYERVRTLFRESQHDFGDAIVRQGDKADAFYVPARRSLRPLCPLRQLGIWG